MKITLFSKLLWRVKRDDGIAATEFGLIAPTFMLLLMGVFDIGYAGYTKAVLQGALEEAGRNASLETTTPAVLDNKVFTTMLTLNKNIVLNASSGYTGDKLNITRKYYERYSDILTPEDFNDANNNSLRDSGECFVDRNGNSTWDADVGVTGRGGAQDVVFYEATLTYTRLFPLWQILGQSETEVIKGRTILRNQPFTAQAARSGVTICT